MLDVDFVRTVSILGVVDIVFDDAEPGAFTIATAGARLCYASVNVGTDINSYTFQTYVHEIGHALGLGHPGNYNGAGNYVTSVQRVI